MKVQLKRLCFVLPADSGEFQPSDHPKSGTPQSPPPPPSPPLPETEKDVKENPRRRDCSSQVLGFIGSLFRKVRDSKWVNLCIHYETASVTQEAKPFHDLEGVQLSGKIGHENPRIFSYSELYIGSNGFSEKEVLGSGGFGRVYRAVLPSDGTVVAVKCLADKGEHFEKTFAAELVAVAQLRHRNLVKLRGWCVHEDELLLVYDYMPNRSLDRVLFRRPENPGGGGPGPLDWERRIKIIRGLAAALFYLHEQLETQIIHRDVKTSNVMLDSHFNARLGDFGLARWLEHELEYNNNTSYYNKSWSSFRNHQFRVAESTRIGGTIGYLPPESFKKRSVATAKSDVFSFGIVVLEVVSGRRAVDLTFPDDRIILVDWVRRLSDEGRLLEAGDTRLTDASYSLSDMERLTHLALLCTLHDPQQRPNMKWVVGALSGEISGKFPSLPSFRGHPLYISLSSRSPTSTSNTTTSTTSPKSTSTASAQTTASSILSNYVTAMSESFYVTAEHGEHDSGSCNNNSRRRSSGSMFVVETPREISYKEIISATNNFSDSQRVAEVDFGTAYHGFLSHDNHVLIKRLGMTKCPALRIRFSTELQNLGRLRHRNLVQLRGWCTEQGEMLVVYDYSASRMLSRVLTGDFCLRWKYRYNIIKSLASAVLYLHEEWDEQVIHRNITSSSVILERDMNPRLCGFALAEFLTRNDHAHRAAAAAAKNKSVRGIFGYMAPEYMESGEATTTADVYSFGVVVLEVVTGQTAVDYRRPKRMALLVMRIRELVGVQKRPLEELVDLRLNEEYDRKELVRLVKLGIMCTRTDPQLRPNMRQVVSILDGNDECLLEEGRKQSRVDREQKYAPSISMIKRMQALGIH